MEIPTRLAMTAVATVVAMLAMPSQPAEAIPVGWSCIGSCGTLGPDGVVSAPPGGTEYDYVTADAGVALGSADLDLGTETVGSILRSNAFSANGGDSLEFYFNYVTSDGAGFADYAWARLLTSALDPVALLFTARTTIGGDTAPGFGMPANSATLVPASTPIIGGGPSWSPLGANSGGCFDTGCGYTGWIQSSYTIAVGGSYVLEFGVVNWDDSSYDSGLALSGAQVAGVPIPEPNTLLLLGAGLLGLACRRRRHGR